MTIGEWLQKTQIKLTQAGVASARLDSLILLEDTLGKDRAYLLAHLEINIDEPEATKLNRQINRRLHHEPLAYIRGKTEFYGRQFVVNKDVLVPRPETETMIDLLKQIMGGDRWKMEDGKIQLIDMGTGSGCLAITAKLELPVVDVIAIDIDPKCLKVARNNALNLNAEVKFLKGDLLEPLYAIHNTPYVILANLPYVPDKFTINEAAMNEPRQAIFGGSDGLNLYRRLFEQIDSKPRKPYYILTESLPMQHELLANIALESKYVLVKTDGFIQAFELRY